MTLDCLHIKKKTHTDLSVEIDDGKTRTSAQKRFETSPEIRSHGPVVQYVISQRLSR